LIDEPLIATGSVSQRRAQRTRLFFWIIVSLIGIISFWNASSNEDGTNEESWIKATVSTVIHRQFQDSISSAKDTRLNDQVKAMQLERDQLQIRLQTLDKLVKSSKIDNWLRELSAVRENENEISYEILIAKPHSTDPNANSPTSNQPDNRITVTVRGIDKFDGSAPEVGVAQSVLRFKTVTHELAAPAVAETIKGKASSKVAKFLIATVTPSNNPAMTEVRIIPVRERSRNP
jgi:hypothetical protein